MLLNVTIPVYNEEVALVPSIRSVHAFLEATYPHDYEVVIVDNGSNDHTREVGAMLAEEFKNVIFKSILRKGRGRALKYAWSQSPAKIVSYTDVDLSTDLNFLPKLVAAILSGADIAIGSRLLPESRVKRCLKREVLSRSYNSLLRLVLKAPIRDAQCGFKALRAGAAAELLPTVQDNEWFFDTELLIRAQSVGYIIHEIPVDWVEDRDSRVNIYESVFQHLRGLSRLRSEKS